MTQKRAQIARVKNLCGSPGLGCISVVCGRGFIAQTLHAAALGFAVEPAKLRSQARARRPPDGPLNRRLPDHLDQPVDGVPAIGFLRAESASRKNDFAILRQPGACDALKPQAHRFRQARRTPRVESQLRGRRHLVDILPAGTAGADISEGDLGLVYGNPVCDRDHGCGRLPENCILVWENYWIETPGFRAGGIRFSLIHSAKSASLMARLGSKDGVSMALEGKSATSR